MAPRLICALAALASAYDWTTPDAGLTPFNCTAFPNPIQVLLPDGQSPPYDVSELDLATGAYTKICPNGFPTTKKVNGFALMQYPATGPQGPALADKVYGFVCRDRKLQRFDCDSISQVDGNLVHILRVRREHEFPIVFRPFLQKVFGQGGAPDGLRGRHHESRGR